MQTNTGPAADRGVPLSPEPATSAETGGHAAGGSRASLRLSTVGPWAVPMLLCILFISFSVLAPRTFGTLANVRVMIGGQATIVLLAMAIIVPLRAGDFDLSISAVMILSGCTIGALSAHNYPPAVACVLAVLIGPAVGVINGLLVVSFGIDSFIATLGSLTILSGLATLISGGSTIATFPTGLIDIASQTFLGFATPVWVGWIIALLLLYIFELTPCGRYLLFIGGNRDAARLAGLRVNAFRRGAFIVSGTLSSMTGLLFSGALGSVDPSAGSAYLLPPVTAAFLGASAIKLGRFNVLGTLVAIYLLAVGITGLQLLGIQNWIVDVFNGACLIGAVGLTRLFGRAASR